MGSLEKKHRERDRDGERDRHRKKAKKDGSSKKRRHREPDGADDIEAEDAERKHKRKRHRREEVEQEVSSPLVMEENDNNDDDLTAAKEQMIGMKEWKRKVKELNKEDITTAELEKDFERVGELDDRERKRKRKKAKAVLNLGRALEQGKDLDQELDGDEEVEMEQLQRISKKDKHKKKEKKKAKAKEKDKQKTKKRQLDKPNKSDPSLKTQPFPFLSQTISQYLPLYPIAMGDPIEGYEDQYLRPLLNTYVPSFKGVLLSYRKITVGDAPSHAQLSQSKYSDTDEAQLESINEYAVGFAWLNCEVDLFKPTRGAVLEGHINLQTEGHLGLVCWGKFNASIEAERLPATWQWVSLISDHQSGGHTFTAQPNSEESEQEDQQDTTEQMHTTGYWADAHGDRITGPLRFRIKNFEVAMAAGNHGGFLSIEGTMLHPEDEGERATREKGRAGVGGRRNKKRSEFGVTRFGGDEEEGDKEKEEKKAEEVGRQILGLQ